ncbi:MAG: SH3 domain-containing protein [Beijerinckiaceae bacterium]
MKRALRLAAPLAAIFVAAPAAYAQSAIMRDDATLRAGPGFNYPRVAYVPEDARVTIHGCLRGYSWCDISWRRDRGWVDASNLNYAWNNRYVVVEEWGPRIGLPVIAFSVEDYWTRYYRDRPWWSQRYTWFERDRNWRGGDGWRGRDRDGGQWDRDNRRGDWRDRQQDGRSDRDGWRNRQQSDSDGWRNRQRTDQNGARERDRDDRQRLQQGQNGGWSPREGRNDQDRRLQQDSGRGRGGDNMSTGRIPHRQQGGGERGERM